MQFEAKFMIFRVLKFPVVRCIHKTSQMGN